MYLAIARRPVIVKLPYSLKVMGITNGSSVVLLPPSQDHKARHEGDQGPNTGGMGAVCPSWVGPEVLGKCEALLGRVVGAMAEEGTPYKGS